MKKSCKSFLDFEFFKRRCEHWKREFNLLDWKTFYEFKELDEAYANVRWDLSGRTAVISLNSSNDEFQDRATFVELLRNIDMSAFHECLHLLYSWYYSILKDINEKHCATMDHQIIRVMENSVFDAMINSEPISPYEQEIQSRNFGMKKKK